MDIYQVGTQKRERYIEIKKEKDRDKLGRCLGKRKIRREKERERYKGGKKEK